MLVVFFLLFRICVLDNFFNLKFIDSSSINCCRYFNTAYNNQVPSGAVLFSPDILTLISVFQHFISGKKFSKTKYIWRKESIYKKDQLIFHSFFLMLIDVQMRCPRIVSPSPCPRSETPYRKAHEKGLRKQINPGLIYGILRYSFHNFFVVNNMSHKNYTNYWHLLLALKGSSSIWTYRFRKRLDTVDVRSVLPFNSCLIFG